jgi:hypothetical protein
MGRFKGVGALMALDAKFWRPIVLRDGRRIATLAEAQVLIQSFPALHQDTPLWRETSDLLVRAAASHSAVDEALMQMVRALKAESLI